MGYHPAARLGSVRGSGDTIAHPFQLAGETYWCGEVDHKGVRRRDWTFNSEEEARAWEEKTVRFIEWGRLGPMTWTEEFADRMMETISKGNEKLYADEHGRLFSVIDGED